MGKEWFMFPNYLLALMLGSAGLHIGGWSGSAGHSLYAWCQLLGEAKYLYLPCPDVHAVCMCIR